MRSIIKTFALVCAAANAAVIKQAERMIGLTEMDATIVQTDLKFSPDANQMLTFTVAADFADTLVEVTAQSISKRQETLPIKRVSGGNDTMLWFEVDLRETVRDRTKDGIVSVRISEIHKRRRVAFPAQASILDRQSFRFQDSMVLLSPYLVQKQSLEIHLPSSARLMEMTPNDDAKTDKNIISFANSPRDVAPYTFDAFFIMFESKDPYMILTEATRKVSISHWGNIAVDEHFRMENIGAKVKGQYSRFDLDIKNAGKSCLREITSEYPYYIKNMYIHDYIGNISSTHALRTHTAVNLQYEPRFPVCGGWQIDWNQGYSMPVRFHLSESRETPNLYKLKIPFYHNYENLLAEDYSVQVTLPFGATDIDVSLPTLTLFLWSRSMFHSLWTQSAQMALSSRLLTFYPRQWSRSNFATRTLYSTMAT